MTAERERREHLVQTSNDAAAAAWGLAEAIVNGETAEGEMAKLTAAGLNGVRVALLAIEEALHAATAPPATDVEAVQAGAEPPLATWAYVELMGHRVIVGYVEADDFVGRSMLRIRRIVRSSRAAGIGEPTPVLELEERWKLYSPASVYSFERISETEARGRWLSMQGQIRDDDDIPF